MDSVFIAALRYNFRVEIIFEFGKFKNITELLVTK
jgi:hypothetical protein